MWRNLGWTAVLVTWTIFLILNSGLAGERAHDNPPINNEYISNKVESGATYPAYDRKFIDNSELKYVKENFKSNDHSSMRTRAVFLKFINRESRDLQFSDYERRIAMSNAMAPPKFSKDIDDKSRWLAAKGVASKDIHSSKVVMDKSRNTRNYSKFMSSLRASPTRYQELKGASRKRRHKERTIYTFSNDRKTAAAIRCDSRAFDEKGERRKDHERERISNGENGVITFLFDESTKRNGKDSFIQKFKNSNTSKFETARGEHTDEKGERDRNKGDFRRSLKATKNQTNKLIYVESSDGSGILRRATFPNYSSLKGDQDHRDVRAVADITNDVVTKDSPYERSVTVAWTTLIFNSRISNAEPGDRENAVSPYHSLKNGHTKSYKADEFLATETYKRDEYSKVGFQANTDADDRKRDENIDAYNFHVSNPLDNHSAKKRVDFTERSFLRKEKDAMKMTNIFTERQRTTDVFGSRLSSINNIDAKLSEKMVNLNELRMKRRTKGTKFIADADYAARNKFQVERGALPTNSSTEVIGELKLDYPTSARISITRGRNPMHVRHVASGADYEHPGTTGFEAEVHGAFRIGPPNVSGPTRIAKFGSPLDRKARSRVKYSSKFDGIDIGARSLDIDDKEATADGRSRRLDGEHRGTSIESESISFGATNTTELRKINGSTQSSSSEPMELGLKSVRIPSGNNRDTHEGSRFYSPSNDVHNSKYRRYKRHEVGNTPEDSTSIEPDSETLDTTRATTSSTLIESTADPSDIVTIRANNAAQISIDAKEFLTTARTLPSSKYGESTTKEWQSIQPVTTNRAEYTSSSTRTNFDGSNSLKIPLMNASRSSYVNLRGTPTLLIETFDQSTAITKIDNSVILKKEYPSIVKANVRISNANKNVSDASIDFINSLREHGAYGSISTTIDPLSQRSSDHPRNVFGNITMGNDNESSSSLSSSSSSSSAGNVISEQWPVKHSAVVEGDLVLGGLMMVHEREDTITCGPVMPQGGVQALEAMLYTLDTLNERGIVPGVKIGAHILDDCDKDTYGLEMAVDFIKGSISNIDGAEYHCNKTAVRKVISGVVGAASSVTSIQVANLLRLFRIPQVSFFSTSPELSNKQRFEYFTRTIPSDHYQVKAMVDIVLTMGWSYVSIIYEESNYGIKAFEELEELLGKHNICIAIKEKLVKDSGVAEETAYDIIVSKLLTKPRARGCIIFGSDQEVAGVMRAVRRCNATGAFSWIGSDGWSARGLVSNGNEPEVEGTLSVQPQANPVKGFEEYFLNLTVENNRRNPWFVEFWEDHFKCRYPNSSWTPYNKKYTKICTTKERLTKQNTAFEDQLQFVSDAVMAFAYAFRDMHRDLCHGKAGLCDAMKPTKGTTLLQYLRKVDFEGLSGDKFKFDKNGDGPARYNIIHFKQTKSGKYKWVRVGKYLEGELRLNMSEIQFKLGHPQPPESVCSLPCEVGQAKKYVEGERCCWHCFNCTQYQIRHPKDETQCIQCRRGTLPDETHSTCRNVPEEFLRPESGWAIGAMSFSATGILVTLFVGGVFLRHNNTPVVRASGRELSYVLLSGILLCYLVTFTLILKPTDIVCGIQRFAAGFCFTVVYAALLTKTNRISRIFKAGSAKRPSFISPRSQLIICSGLVFVQILINVVWMIIDPARAMHHYPSMEDNLLVCNNYIDASYMIAFAYPTILIIVCTVYAILTRKIPEAFNESKHIGLTMYTTCVIWFAFVPLYYGTGSNVALRITSMSVTISLSASVTVVCLFSPKLYIILIRPERNVRPTVRAGRPNLTKNSAITVTNASSMMGPVTATTVLTAATCDQNKAIKKHIASTIDCSTQSECYELELKDWKNGEPPTTTCTSRSTQTISNEKDFATVVTNKKESPDVIATASNKESKNSVTTTKRHNNNARIGNGPLSQNDISL